MYKHSLRNIAGMYKNRSEDISKPKVLKPLLEKLKGFFAKNSKHTHIYLGVGLLAVALVFVAFIFSHSKINSALVIKSAETKQLSAIVPGGKPVQWSVFVKKSDITKKNYLAKLPKNAQNIKITTVSATQAKAILSIPIKQLPVKEKKQLALSNTPRSFFAASLLDSFIKYFKADLDGAVQTMADATDPAIQQTSDGTAVDLSSQAPTATPDTSPSPSSTPDKSPEGILTGPSQSGQEPSLVGDTSTPTPTPTPTPNPDNQDLVKIDYTTPAPDISEQSTDTGKLITVSAPNEDPAQPLVDVLAFTSIPKIYKVGQESKIHIKWKNNGDKNVTFTAMDTNNDGWLDYVEWTVPHLSTQEFQIIFTSKAFHLDSNQNILEDVYPQTQTEDGNYVTIPANDYVRVTFNAILDKTKDITLHTKPSVSGKTSGIEIYPVYTDSDGNQNEGPRIATINGISAENNYRAELYNLETPTDTFDLKILNNDISIDYIVDPTAWLTGWAHRKLITISHTNVHSYLSNFPALIKLTADADLAQALSTGNDIRFTDNGGRSTLYYEKESWSGGGGSSATGIFWVNIPTISSTQDTTLYVYYGNAGAPDGQDAGNVWTNGYAGVWHFDDAGNPTSLDSTSNGNTATNYSTTGSAGPFGGGAENFDGTNSYVVMSQNPLSCNADFDINLWANARTLDGTYDGLIDPGTDGQFKITRDPGSQFFQVYFSGPIYQYPTISAGSWHLYSLTRSGNTLSLYLDSVLVSSNTVSDCTGSNSLGLGTYRTGIAEHILDGLIAETRIGTTSRSADWITFEYHNQADSDSDLTIANQENSLTWLSGWNNRQKITIDHTKVGSGTEDETDFPVLVSIPGLTGANANGTDIRFTADDGGTYLPREIESYPGGPSTPGTLTAWVKIPHLSHTADTVIYMYFGNASATEPAPSSTYGSQNVWTNGYAGVWHLNDAANGTIHDSTANGNTGTNNSNNVTATSGPNGLGAGSFDGQTGQTYLNFGNNIGHTQTLTATAWFKTTANVGAETLFDGGFRYGYNIGVEVQDFSYIGQCQMMHQG